MAKPIPERVGKFIALLASDKDGEVLAAVSAIKRALAAEQLDLNDLAKALNGGSTPVHATMKEYYTGWPFSQEAPPRHYNSRSYRQQQQDDDDVVDEDVNEWSTASADDCEILVALLDIRLGLSAKERKFVNHMHDNMTTYGKRFKLTDRQRHWLWMLADRELEDQPVHSGRKAQGYR